MSAFESPESILAALVATPSSSSADERFDRSNRDVIDRLAAYAEAAGGVVELRPVRDLPGKWNLIAEFGSGEGGLVLSGHSDTVPWDESGWASDPFSLTERDGRLVGLGATDMKGFFPAALHAIRTVGVASLRRSVVLVATADEESGMHGARSLLLDEPLRGAEVIIGEPTGLRPITMHKGVAQDRIILDGRAGHASDPSLGVNAIDAMVSVLEALVRYRQSLLERRDERFAVATPTLNFGRIAGGDSANRICGRCELHVDERLLPGMTLAEARDDLAQIVREAVRDPRIAVTIEPLFAGIEPFATPIDARIVALAEAITGVRSSAVPFGTEAPMFSAMGKPTIVLGPGDIELAHQPNESIDRAELHRAVDVYARFIHRTCVEEPS